MFKQSSGGQSLGRILATEYKQAKIHKEADRLQKVEEEWKAFLKVDMKIFEEICHRLAKEGAHGATLCNVRDGDYIYFKVAI